MEDDTRSVIINVPKPRLCTKSSNEIFRPIIINSILKQTMDKRSSKPSDSDIGKYHIPCDKPLPSAHFKKEELLVPYKAYTKTQQNDRRKQKLAIRLYDRHKVVSTDLKKRRYIENPPDVVQAITDVDKRFFTCISGRPSMDRAPLFKSLKAAVADILRIKQEIGSRHEAILNFEVNNKQELHTYYLSLQRCMEQVKCFDSFISADYRNSMSFLEKWEKLKLKLHNKVLELQHVATKEFSIISRLMGLDYLYGLQQKYGRFLYYLSPPSWRAKNRDFALSIEIEAKGFDLGNTSEEDTFNIVFDKMQKECFGNFIKPVLYFTHPRDLINIFDGIEKQQLHHFAYITHLAPPKKMLKEGIACLKDVIAQESAFVANTIAGLVKLLEFSNERCIELETRFLMILNGLFYESVGAPDVLKLFLHLEFCYEKVYAEKAINMDIVAMAKALEECWMDYSKRLEAIHSDTVKKAVVKCVEMERRKMRRARLAARELRDFDRLERDLLRAHEPIVDKFQPRFQQSLPPIKGALPRKTLKREYFKTNIKKTEQKRMHESELEYLTLFTDWTEGDDPNKYLHRLEDEV